MTLVNLIKKNQILVIVTVAVIVVIVIVIYNGLQNSTVDMKLYKQLYDNHVITEYIKNKHLDLNIGNKSIESNKNYRIPFIIYRTWKNDKLTEQFQEAWDITAKNNPEFTQKLYTDLDVNNFKIGRASCRERV